MKMRNLMGAFLALAGLAFGGSASGGNVWEFIHDSPKSMPYSAGEEITFRMRLLSPNYEEEKDDRLTWSKWPNMDNVTVQSYFLKDPTHAAEYLNADYPLAIGVVANGKTYGAVFQGSNPTNDNLGTDFTFRYAVKCGDYALPLRLAANGNGLPVGAGQWSADAAEDSTRYYFLNGPGDANDIWTITTSRGDVFDRQFVTGTEAAKNIMKREETFVGDGTYLKSFAYSLETLEYDDETAKGDDDNDYWRVVRGSTAEPKDATMRTADGLEPVDAGIVVYAWIAPGGGEDEDPTTWDWASAEYAVSIPLDGGKHVSQETFFDPDQNMSSDTPRKHNVYTFRIAPPTKSYSLPLKGLVVGKTARVILSSTKHWDYTSAGNLEEDFRFKTVFCGEQQPTLSVSVDNYDNPATFPDANHELTDYTRAERLRVRLEGVETHAALTVKLAFELGDSSAFPTNVISISRDKEAGFDVKNLLAGLEVTIPENKQEPDEPIWLFVLGATKETATPPGIGIRPVPDAAFATPIPNTNALRVIIRGMNPVATAVNDVDIVDGEPTVLSAIRDGQLDLRVRVEDSYRNLALLDAGGTNGFYTVTFDRGYSKAMTITNNAAGGPLVPVDYFSDGYAYLNFTVPYTSQTNDYAATFKLMNPDGLESKTYSLTVPVREGYSVSASAPDGRETEDGFFELMESDTDRYRINFQLSDILGADGANLWAFLEPANEVASNRTDGAFFTVRKDGTAGTGVPVNTLSSGKGSTGIDYALGGILILDGDGKGDGSGNTAQYNVVLCTQQAYDADKVFTVYDGSTRKFTLILDNHRPEFKQLVLREDGETTPLDSSITNGETVTTAVRVNKAITVEPHKTKGWSDVDMDLTAADDKQVVVRWRIYELDDDGSAELYDVKYTFGTARKLELGDGFSRIGRKRIIAQIQDKDMRATNTVQWVEDEGRWAYYVDPEYGVEGDSETWDADDEEINWWGPEMSFVFKVSENPRIFVSADGFAETAADGQPIFSESQLFPHSGANDPTMKFNVELEEGIKSTWVTVRVEVAVAPNTTAKDGYVTLGATNIAFYGTSKLTAAVPITDFDATYRDGMKNPAKWVVTTTIAGISKEGELPIYDSTPYVFYLQNVGPKLELAPDGDSQQYSDYVDSELVYELAKDDIVDLSWLARDIRPDLTNISVTATISGGKIIADDRTEVLTYTRVSTNAAEVVTNQENFAYSAPFSFKFSNMGTNKIVFVAKDKDNDTSEKHTIRFFVPTTKTLLLYPSKPTTPSTDSDDIADYFSAAGIGYGHVWADGETSLSSISKWIHNWTCSESGVVMAYAMGYSAKEREVDGKSPAFVNEDGNSGTGTGYYAPSAKSGYDSFFYRWFAKTQSNSSTDKSNWTPYKPVPQVSTNQATAAAGSAISLSFPKKTGSQDTEYNDISALAVFSRELLTTDNMGDINADGVPDSFVVKYKLVEEFAGGADLNDVNYSEDGSTPYCLDYLPQTLTVRYSQLIPELTDIANIENAEAFTPRLKIRGYDETDVQSLAKRRATYGAAAEIIPGISALNDAAEMAGIDGAVPSRKYVNPREDADSTLNYVEWLAWSEYAAANGYDPADAAKWSTWSPERPTDPTKADFDNDGFTDGYEYYIWYRAHVGWIDENGIHRYLTGRAYDSRNPGEGQFISSERIVELFDPRAKGAADNTQDTDNDGLPDLIEFEIGTNPFDFDTDGDGLPDGFEIIVAGTDPLTDHTAKDAKHDAARNYDGDAMAFTTVTRESGVLPLPRFIQRYYTFATVEADGDTDGIQWYVETPLDGGVSAFTYDIDEGGTGVRFTVGGVDYVTTAYAAAVDLPVTADGRLAITLGPDTTFAVTNAADAAEALGVEIATAEWLRLKPTRIGAGTPLAGDPQDATFATATVKDLADEGNCNAAWVYGSEKVNVSGSEFGFLALGRYKLPAAGAVLAELPTKDRDVAFLHYLVYQQWGFDPRTAWSWKTPLAARWGENSGDLSYSDQTSKKLGYAGTATRTRAFTAYDEFLLYSFFLNNGCDMSGYTEADAEAPYLAKVWMAFCTNPRGVGEPAWAGNEHYQGWTAQRDENGCDTDGDGVPDGWELYVMAGPKMGKGGKADPKNGKFVFAPPYAKFTAAGEEVIVMPESYFSPFVDSAQDSETDNKKYIGKDMNDGLTEYQEFVSTDACAWYDEVQAGETAPYALKPLLPADWKWLNKFFPTDPWVADTDDDGVKDNEEGSAFTYAEAADLETYRADKLKAVYPGCGLNPCSVDTDMDGLPDGWEKQFAGKTVSTNAVEGLIDGMDGTVADAQTDPAKGPNRDYDRDGLENWQEYMTGTMRCWRYDDPFTQWGSIPFEAYYYIDPEFGFPVFEPDFEALGIEGADEDELWNNFWYETLAHVGGPIYNPHLVFDQSPTAQYFSRVDKGWDPNYFDKVLMGESEGDDDKSGAEHRYYWFAHRIGARKYKDAWAAAYGKEGWFSASAMDPERYVSCSPVCEDSDQDGLDDYYELFHGLNPLLGGDVLPVAINPCDLVRASKAIDKGGPASWSSNPWTARPFAKARGTDPDYDFTVYPWKNGLQTADPDGDNERNYVEAIMAKFDSATGFHGDPSPMWMTDASYSNSLTRLHYRMPMRNYGIFMSTTVTDRNGDTVPGFTGPDGTAYFFRDFDAYSMNDKAPGTFEGFSVDRWKVGGGAIDPRVSQVHYDRGQEGVGGWMFSFEENEGYDTDHDGLNDAVEIAGRAHGATDPIDADSPRRRQAMYFPGEASALQTPPQLIEAHPIVGAWYDEEFPFREYTVECWVRPDDVRNATVVERAILTKGANAGDRELVRKNFQLAIRKSGDTAYWFTKFDSNGTGTTDSDEVSVLSADEVVPGAWTHLAATFDGAHLTLFVNGKPSGTSADTTDSKQQPECGVSEVNIRTGGTAAGDIYRTDGYADGYGYGYHAIVVGASVRSYSDYDLPFTEQWCGYALNLYNALGWSFYRDFFKGYVDEVRIWDGARSVTQIAGSMGVRFDAEMAKANRAKVYDQWKEGRSRYRKDGSGRDYEGVEPELRYHFAFDSLLAADSAEALAKVPTGFANGPSAPYSRPDDYEIAWWKRVLGAYGSAYAGAANYVTWIPNTVAHLPRFDGTTLDSAFWSADFAGDKSGTYTFANAAEPYSLWTQWLRGNLMGEARSTLLRYSLANGADPATTGFMDLFMFTGRNQLREGCDLLPLGGAYARYCEAMWDGQGPSTTHEITGNDADSDGLPDWWEKYADEQYRGDLDPSVRISWDTVIDYHGMKIAAGEAYLRDLAKGAYGDGNGKIAVPPTKYLQIADQDANGIPDWWANLYGIAGESGLDDHDKDGLPNYVEYLLSEVFKFDVVFNPVKACSVQPNIPDYFYRVGELYVGEIFTDHDLVDDVWEDLYDAGFASRRVSDAAKDADNDGWSNRSEVRYSKQVMPIVADQVSHYTAADGLTADYPIPTIALTLHYNGAKSDAVESAPIVVQMTTERKLERAFEAVYKIAGTVSETTGEGQSASTGRSSKDDGNDTSTAYTRSLGKWSNRHALGTLTPGYINQNSVKLEYCYDPSAEIYSWTVRHYYYGYEEGYYFEDKRGTRSEFDADKRKYGDANVTLMSRDTEYRELVNVRLRTDENSKTAFWEHTSTGERFGTLDLVSGAFDIDFGVFKNQYVVNGTNANDRASLEDQTYRIAYSVNPAVGLPRKLYLGEATTGHVREGRNTIVAFADLDANGSYTAGEPYGCVTDVDVSWKGTEASLELTEISAVCPRMNIADGTSDREFTWGTESGYWTNHVIGVLNGGTKTRVRVVRSLVNTYAIAAINKQIDTKVTIDQLNRVVLDKYVDLTVNPLITEADFFAAGELDIDWSTLRADIPQNVWDAFKNNPLWGEIIRFDYRVVLGEGTIDLEEVNNLHKVMFSRVFDDESGRKLNTPIPIAPGPTAESTLTVARPTFRWKLPGNTASTVCSYPAFRIVVSDTAGAVVYDSGIQRTPALNRNYEYVWPAPISVGDRTPSGKVFANNSAYSWKVSMYNCKFKTDSYSATGDFYVNVTTNGYDCGHVDAAVKYFGPKDAASGRIVRVRAYASPDFTGTPVAGGFIDLSAQANMVSLTNDAVNCRIIGLPKGSYYLQAFIDSNANGVCDAWESMGYLCRRDGSTADYLNPTAITFDSKVGKGDLAVIYLEDADTDGDGLPDAWEYAEYGSLTAKGVELLTETKAGEFVVNPAISGALALQENAQVPTAGLAGEVRNTIMKLSSPAGVSAATGIDPANVEVTDGGLVVKSEIDPETLTIVGFAVDAAQNRVLLKVGAETTADINPTVANFLNITVKKGAEVTVRVEHAESPNGPWEIVPEVNGTVTVDRAGADIEVKLNGELPAQGYFRAKVEE